MKEILNIWGSVFLFSLSFLAIAFPDDHVGKWLSDRAPLLLGSFLVLAIVFLLLRQKKLMLSAFISCGLLAFSLKLATQHTLVYEKSLGNKDFTVMNVVLSDNSFNPSSSLETIMENKADVLFFQEVDPWWHAELKKTFDFYEHKKMALDEQTFSGIHVYSKFPFAKDTVLVYDGKTSMKLMFELPEAVEITNTFLFPAFAYLGDKSLDQHVDTLMSFIDTIETSKIVLGDFNQVQWSGVVQNIKKELGLKDSRIFTHLETPTDQIFHSENLRCVKFRTLSNAYSEHIGILATFELIPNES